MIRPLRRGDRSLAGVEQQEAAGAVGAFGVSGREARLSEQRRLLVADRRRDRDPLERSARLAVDLRRRPDLGQHRPRHADRVEQRVVPVERREVHQHRAAGVGHVGQVPAGQAPDQPRVDRPEHDLARLRALTQTRDRVQQPAHLGTREVGRQRQAGALPEAVATAVDGELADQVVGARVLPVDRVVDRCPGLAVPDQRRLALVCDPERDEVRRPQVRFVERGRDDVLDIAPELLGIVLDPAWSGEDLMVLLLRDRHDSP